MKLSALLEGQNGMILQSAGGAKLADPAITGITCDSRLCKAGTLFVAVDGTKEDGASYVPQAARAGAAAVLCNRPLATALPQIVTADVRLAMAQLAAAFYGHPDRALGVVGVTGTCGKTTIAYLLRHIFRALGKPCGMIGTVEYDLGGALIPSPLTTPQSADFQSYLAQMACSGAVYCVSEVSSHALHQKRVAGCNFAGAVFTNLSREHLDYHLTIEEYAKAKKLLFDGLDARAVATVNLDDAWGKFMLQDCAARTFTYGMDKAADYRIGQVAHATGKTEIVLHYGGCKHKLLSSLEGTYNVYNVVAAVSLAAEIGFGLYDVAQVLPEFAGVPGRLEGIDVPGGVRALVDYAHKPDALEKALQAVRPLTKNKLVVVFGCGGDRDRGKRPLMGRIACELADEVVVTSDNPRSEEPQAIIDEILAGCAAGQGRVHAEADRRSAIEQALSRAGAGDVVLIAGKGHEDYQIIGGQKIHFDDREVVREFAGRCKAERQG